MIISKEKIESFIPQRPPFVMVDNLTDVTDKSFKTDFRVMAHNIFAGNGLLSEYALIEHIAQSSSAGLAYTNRDMAKKNMDGYIGSVSKLKIYGLPKVNDTIHTIVDLVARFGNMFLVKGASYLNGRKLIECEMKLVGA